MLILYEYQFLLESVGLNFTRNTELLFKYINSNR